MSLSCRCQMIYAILIEMFNPKPDATNEVEEKSSWDPSSFMSGHAPPRRKPRGGDEGRGSDYSGYSNCVGLSWPVLGRG